MSHTLLNILLAGVYITLFIGVFAKVKDPVEAKAWRFVFVVVIIFALVSLIGCHMITSGMRIE
jgi:hypothetical protein